MSSRPLTDEQRARLNHVVASPGEVDLANFPDFLVIGPQRTGSTWLHRNLTRHPEIFMTEPKELYYFSSVQWPDYHPKQLPPIEPELRWYLRFFDEAAADRKERQRQCRHEFGVDYTPRVRGEASATYAVACQPPVIEDIRTLNPAIKAVMLVRHPYDRAWSHIKKELVMDGGWSLEAVRAEHFTSFLENKYEVDCSLFSDAIHKWRGVLGEDRVFVGDFRDVEANPGDLLARLYRFLGVDDDPRFIGALAKVQICYTPPSPVPAAVLPLLDELYGQELIRLAELGFDFERPAAIGQ